MKWTITENNDNMMIRDFLRQIAQFSKRLLVKAKSQDGKILVNGEFKTVRYVLKQGDILEIILPKEQLGNRMTPEEIPLSIVYEDDYILLLNKPAGMATIPSRHHPAGTIANGVLHYYAVKNIPSTVHVVTRLDRDTSGLLLIAKNQYSHSLLSNLQKRHAIHRKYMAVVSGQMFNNRVTIDVPIGRKENSIIERTITAKGKKAITHYEVLKAFKNKTLLEVRLETGRTHQIRVHFSSIGHPLLGDDLYGGDTDGLNRQALHCSEISFQHPFTAEKMTFSSSLAKDIAAFLPKC